MKSDKGKNTEFCSVIEPIPCRAQLWQCKPVIIATAKRRNRLKININSSTVSTTTTTKVNKKQSQLYHTLVFI